MSIDLSTLQNLGLTLRENASAAGSNSLDQDDFLELMMTQLNNQDPMNPTESSDFLGQIAQMATVTGIDDLQKSFSSFATSMTSEQAIQAADLVGRSVLVSSNIGILESGSTVSGEIDVSADASAVTVNVYDSSGELVKEMNLGAYSEGEVSFTWDGTNEDGDVAEPGTYYVVAGGTIAGQNVALETRMEYKVDSVTLGQNSEGMAVNLSGIGKVSFDDVQKIL